MKSDTTIDPATGASYRGFLQSQPVAGNATKLRARENYGREQMKGNEGSCHDPMTGRAIAKNRPAATASGKGVIGKGMKK